MRKVLIAAMISIGLVGCGGNTLKPNTYAERVVGSRSYVTMARVESVRKVEIEGGTSGIGSGTGVLLGGAAGYNTIGKGSGRTYGALLGAMLGWAASSAIEKNMNSRAGVELTVLTENRSRYVLVQDDDGTVFNIGDVVKLVDNNGKTRVIK